MNITTLLDKVYFAPRLKKIDFYATVSYTHLTLPTN